MDKEFITHLREELLRQQDRRAAYVRTKFGFVIALFGLVATLQSQGSTENAVWINMLLYAIPFVTGLFDLYILGGEYAVKRIRGFLSQNDNCGNNEKKWIEFVDTWPKQFMRMNRFWVTNFITLIAGGLVVWNINVHNMPDDHWFVFSAWSAIVVLICLYLYRVELTIWGAFSRSIKQQRD